MAYAGCADGGGDVGHCVVDCQAGGYAAAGGVYVQRDGLARVICFEEEELCYYACGGCFVYGAVEEDDAFAEEAGEYVVWWVALVRCVGGRGAEGVCGEECM